MTEPRQRRVGAYAKLLANYASDDSIIEAGEAAELLFVRGLAFCANSDSDGYITDSQVVRFVGAGMRDAMKRADKLATVGLWERVDGGYVVRSWLRIHESAEEKGRKRRADRERKRVPSPPDFPPDSTRIPNGFHERGASESLLGSYVSSYPSTEQNNDTTEQGITGQGSDTATTAAVPPSMFCPEHPTGTEKPCGPCGTAKLRYKAWSQERLDHEITRKKARAVAIADCDRCDENGLLLDAETKHILGRCDHRRAS